MATLTIEDANALIDAVAVEYTCENCWHAAMKHVDRYGCCHEPGDRDGAAEPPCQCPGDELTQKIVGWIRGRRA